jgi:uncharacterized membrane protein
MFHQWRLCVAVVGIGVSAACAAADEPFFLELGDLPGGIFVSYAKGISADGRVCIGESVNAGYFNFWGYRWTQETGMNALDLPPDTISCSANDTDAIGFSITGHKYYRRNSRYVQEAYRWIDTSGFELLGDLPGGDFYSVGTGISGDGRAIVGSSESGTYNNVEAFRWTSETGMVGLGFLPGSGNQYSRATDISGDGTTVVGFSTSGPTGQRESFYWTVDEGMVGLGKSPGGWGTNEAYGVSWNGTYIVGKMTGVDFPEAFRWSEQDGFVGLGDLPGSSDYSWAYAVSADGSVVGGYSSADYHGAGTAYAFIWDEQHGMRAVHEVLEALGVEVTLHKLSVVHGISADGRTLTGYGTHENGDIEAWIAYLGNPCPGDFNKDNSVDEQDFTAFLDAFIAGHYTADYKADATIDSRDFIAFLNDWVLGCE